MIDKDDNYVLGIDLGTSNSSAAIMKNHELLVIPNEFGLLNTPSYVSFLQPEKRLVGQLSKMDILSNNNTIFNSKRLIGKKFSDKLKKEIEEKLPFKIIGDKETKKIKIEVCFLENGLEKKEYYYPEHISAIILRKIKDDAEKFLSKKVQKKISIKKVVITTPANFNQNQRKETKQAAEIADLEVIGMINEPTAASLAYGLYKIEETEDEKKIIVLDFGGGTLDFTLLTLTKNDNGIFCDVEGSFGDSNFGGEDFDNALMMKILEEYKIDYKDIDEYQKLRLKLACEKAKIELSNTDSTNINLEEFSSSQYINKYITQKEFLKICNSKFEKFKIQLKEFITICDIEEKKPLISDIILIGGTTKIPEIVSIIRKEFPSSNIRNSIDPTLSVAKGAAIQASMIINPEEYGYINLIDVTNLSIGTNVFKKEKNREIMDIIIKRCSELPAFGEKIYKTKEDNQTYIINNIYEGEKEDLSENLPYWTNAILMSRLSRFESGDWIFILTNFLNNYFSEHGYPDWIKFFSLQCKFQILIAWSNTVLLGTFKICNLPKRKKGLVNIKLCLKINRDSILEAKAIDLSNEINSEKIILEEPKGLEDKELNYLKNEEIRAEVLNFPGYDKIRDNIIEKQMKLESLEKKEKSLYLDILKDLFSLISFENEGNFEKINCQIYISYIKYMS